MFENLVESGSHKEDLGRKGSFLLGTVAIYTVIGTSLLVFGIMYANADLDRQDLELTTLVAPVPVPQQATPDKPQETKPNKDQNVDVRKELIADVAESRVVPKEVSAKASDIPPVRRGVTTVIGNESTNAAAPIAAGPGTGLGTGTGAPKVNIEGEPPPPPPAPTPPRAPISVACLMERPSVCHTLSIRR